MKFRETFPHTRRWPVMTRWVNRERELARHRAYQILELARRTGLPAEALYEKAGGDLERAQQIAAGDDNPSAANS